MNELKGWQGFDISNIDFTYEHKAQCVKCASEGGDKSGDNLHVYCYQLYNRYGIHTGASIQCQQIPIGNYDFDNRYVKCGRYRDWETDRKSTRLNSSHSAKSRMPSSA